MEGTQGNVQYGIMKFRVKIMVRIILVVPLSTMVLVLHLNILVITLRLVSLPILTN